MTPLSLTIGIPAYNEQNNIARLIGLLLKQEQVGFVLEKIIVVSDGSTDKTAEIVKSINDSRIHLIANEKRQGQNFSQQLIFTTASADAVVIIEADTIPASKDYLINLTSDYLENRSVCLVQGNPQLLPPITMFGKMIAQQKQSYGKYAESHLLEENICSGRGGRFFSKAVYKNLVWPEAVPEDAYALLWCRSNDFVTKFAKEAKMYFQPPQNLRELVNEQIKIQLGKRSLFQYFRAEQINQLYSDFVGIYKTQGYGKFFNMAWDLFGKNPFYFFYYLIVKLYLGFVLKVRGDFNPKWPMNTSTKELSKAYED